MLSWGHFNKESGEEVTSLLTRILNADPDVQLLMVVQHQYKPFLDAINAIDISHRGRLKVVDSVRQMLSGEGDTNADAQVELAIWDRADVRYIGPRVVGRTAFERMLNAATKKDYTVTAGGWNDPEVDTPSQAQIRDLGPTWCAEHEHVRRLKVLTGIPTKRQ